MVRKWKWSMLALSSGLTRRFCGHSLLYCEICDHRQKTVFEALNFNLKPQQRRGRNCRFLVDPVPKEEIDWTMRKQAKAPRGRAFFQHGNRFSHVPGVIKRFWTYGVWRLVAIWIFSGIWDQSIGLGMPSCCVCMGPNRKLPRGGTTWPWKTGVYVESTVPATRNRLLLAKVGSMSFCVDSLEMLHTGVLDTLVAAFGLVRFLWEK